MDGMTGQQKKTHLYGLPTLSWEDRLSERLVNSSGCKIVNMALNVRYKLHKTGNRDGSRTSSQCSLEALWYKAFLLPKNIAIKKSHYSGEKREVFSF